MGKQDDESWFFLIKDGTQCQIELRETRTSALAKESMAQTHICWRDEVKTLGVNTKVAGNIRSCWMRASILGLQLVPKQ